MIRQIYGIVLVYILSFYYFNNVFQFSSVQFSCSVMSNFLWSPWTAACQASLSITNSWSLLKLMSIELVMPSNHLILCHLLLLLPSIFSSIMVFSKESVLNIRWPKLLEFQLQHQSFQWIFIGFPLEWTGWISLQSKELSRAFSNTTVQKHQFFDFHILSININSISISKASILCLSHMKCKNFYEVQFVIINFLLFTILLVSHLRTSCLTTDIMSQRSQFQKVAYSIIPFIWHS